MTVARFKIRSYAKLDQVQSKGISHHDLKDRRNAREGWEKNSAMLPDNAFADDITHRDSCDDIVYYPGPTHVMKDYIE